MGIYVAEKSDHYRERIDERLEQFRKALPSRVSEFRDAREASTRRIVGRWEPALTLFDGILLEAHSAGDKFYQKHHNTNEITDDPVFRVLTMLHVRACSVASEIRALIVTGHSFGASAHCRTLHEIAVVSSLIREYGADLAQRYMDHAVIDSYRAAREYDEITRVTTAPALDPSELAALAEKKDELVGKHGEGFDTLYGWASKLLGKKRPSYRDLQIAAGLDDVQSIYTQASHLVHAASLGTSQHLYSEGDRTVLLSGPKNWGLGQPACEVLYALALITNRYISLAELAPYGRDSAMEDIVSFALQEMVQEAVAAFSRIESEFEHTAISTRAPDPAHVEAPIPGITPEQSP
jgi:hypothetical protein